MRTWIATVIAIAGALIAGLAIRQVVNDLSDNADLWQSVTDAPEGA